MNSILSSARVSPSAYQRANDSVARQVYAVFADHRNTPMTNEEVRRHIPAKQRPSLSRIRHGIAALMMDGKIGKQPGRAKTRTFSKGRALYQFVGDKAPNATNSVPA